MENMKQKNSLFDRPFLSGVAAIVIAVFLIPALGHIPEFVVKGIQELQPEAAASADLAATGKLGSSILTIIFSFVVLLVLRLRFRKNGFQGCFSRTGFRNKEAWLFVLGGLLLDIVVSIVTAAAFLPKGTGLVLPTITTVLLSFEAGIYEETSYRGIPVFIMMKNAPSRGRMWMVIVITSVMFGLIHMVNLISGAAPAAAAVQTVYALSIGFLLGAIYMRTGNILLTMVYHSVHDVISMMNPTQVTGVMLQTSYSIPELALTAGECVLFIAAALFLLRKSKWEEIRKTWADIWGE